jgi:hypothetical protein
MTRTSPDACKDFRFCSCHYFLLWLVFRLLLNDLGGGMDAAAKLYSPTPSSLFLELKSEKNGVQRSFYFQICIHQSPFENWMKFPVIIISWIWGCWWLASSTNNTSIPLPCFTTLILKEPWIFVNKKRQPELSEVASLFSISRWSFGSQGSHPPQRSPGSHARSLHRIHCLD